MSCSVAVANSPMFSPPSSLFCNKSSMISPAPETLTLPPPPPSALSPSGLASCSSPSSPFRIRIPNPPSGLSCSGPGSPVTQLKRKRPAKLCIPVVSSGFGTGPPTLSTAGRREMMEEDREGYYYVCCKRGRREALEDRYSASLNLEGDSKQAIFGIFDGHGGAKAAEFAAENLSKNILDEVGRRGDDEIEEAIKHGYLNTDSDFLKEDFRGGSCSLTALIRNGNLVVSNAGDCRAVLSSGGAAEVLTSDHRPSREDEKARIENLGGYVDLCRGVWRIQGSLAVSRGIGDRHLKQYVIPEPETKVLRIKPEHEFIIMASDGLWDKVSNQEAVDVVRPSCLGTDGQTLVACKNLIELSTSRGSCDDISVMVVELRPYL
ncbi:probable protein phosphatase 2C 25 [Pyrus communis]|uniref:probable protein phosphatase 2C 25 n=1 Tax=Pyrus communis TaxID=23211 RepID=UPI0035C01B14